MTATLEVWFHRHNGVDLLGGASSVEFALPASNGIAFTIRLKDIREAARSQNSRSIGKYDSAEIILLHYNNRDVAQSNLSDHCLNPGQVYDVNVHGGTYNQPIIFRIVPEENMSYLAASTVTASLSCSPEATKEAAISTFGCNTMPHRTPVTSPPVSLPATAADAAAEMDDASVATSSSSTDGIPGEKTVVMCGQGHAMDPGNVDYARAIQLHQPAFLNGRNVRDYLKCNDIVDQIIRRFEFHQQGQVLSDEAARTKVKQQLRYRRASLPVIQALDQTKSRATIGATHQKRPGASRRRCTGATSSSGGVKRNKRGRDKTLVTCGRGQNHTPGNLTYVKAMHRQRPAYIQAMDARHTATCRAMIDQILDRFEFEYGDGRLLPDEAARCKVRHALNDRTLLR